MGEVRQGIDAQVLCGARLEKLCNVYSGEADCNAGAAGGRRVAAFGCGVVEGQAWLADSRAVCIKVGRGTNGLK